MDKHDNQDNVTSQGDARRKFIRGVGTGLVLASLPARSVWATGGNNASVMGSMSTSSAMNTESLVLRSHGYFKNHYSSFPTSYERYEDCFGGKPIHIDASKIKLITEESSNWRGEYKPCLADVVQCEGDGQDGVAMELDDGRIIPDKQINPTYVGVNAQCKKKHSSRHKNETSWVDHDEVGIFNLSGPGNLNTQMVTMFLNAAHHGQAGIYYPVLRQFGGSFDSLAAFGAHLYNLAENNPSTLGGQLAWLIDNHGI